jgi:uncharacterized protein YycO
MQIKKKSAMAIVIAMLGISIGMPFATIPSANSATSIPPPDPPDEEGWIIQVRSELEGIDKFWNTYYWIHTMLYVGDNQVIHSDGDGVHYSTMEYVWNKWKPVNYAYLKVKGNPDINAVKDFADGKRGRGFDSWSLCHCNKQANPPEGWPWSGYYCTELVWASYKCGANINIEYTPDIWWVNPLEIYHSNQVEIKYV